jgi:hypothetical protein
VALTSAPQVGEVSPHPIHSSDRVWTETNCYVDLWVELLHALGLDPVPAAACAFSADFLGDQWTFLKFMPEDLRDLYGIEVAEMNVWRPVGDHVVEQLALGNLVTVEADAWWLPDTAGVSYRSAHVKTTIAPLDVDPVQRRMRYVHNAGQYHLEGDDFDHVFVLRAAGDGPALPPYLEIVRLGEPATGDELVRRTEALLHAHVARRAADDAVERLGVRVIADLPWLRREGMETFHLYAFGIVRQFGLTCELAADVVHWLTDRGRADLAAAAESFRDAARSAKTLQFQLARAVSGRDVDLSTALAAASASWRSAMTDVVAWHEAGSDGR